MKFDGERIKYFNLKEARIDGSSSIKSSILISDYKTFKQCQQENDVKYFEYIFDKKKCKNRKAYLILIFS